jgi:hypothetical protein
LSDIAIAIFDAARRDDAARYTSKYLNLRAAGLDLVAHQDAEELVGRRSLPR